MIPIIVGGGDRRGYPTVVALVSNLWPLDIPFKSDAPRTLPVKDCPVDTSNHQLLVQTRRLRRQRRVRNRLFGTALRPRLAIFRSSKHIYAQLINDDTATTLVSASTMDPEVRGQLKYGGNKSAATLVGRIVAERAKHAGIDKICFDRRSYKYHGRVAALAEAAREVGLKF